MAAVAYTKQRSGDYTSSTAKLFSMVPSNSYPAGGEPVVNTDVGLKSAIDMILFGPAVKTTGAFMLVPAFDPTTNKIRFFYPSGGATAAPATVAAPLTTTGGSTASAVNATTPALTPGGGKEVPTGADLSDFIVYGVAFGLI